MEKSVNGFSGLCLGEKKKGRKKMKGKVVLGVLFALLLIGSTFTTVFNIKGKLVNASKVLSDSSSADGNSGALVPILGTFTTVMKSNTTAWDTSGIGSPFVLYDADAGLYKMWYEASSPPYPYTFAIAYAESYDGVVWFNKQNVQNTDGLDYYQTGTPWVLKENGTYRMWHYERYEWVAGDWSNYIALMSSPDGISWPAFQSSGDVKVLSAQGQTDLQGDGYNVQEPCVIWEPGVGYVMWYSVYDHYRPGTGGPCKIWRATSNDGITWSNRQLSLPYVSGTWEQDIMHPSVVREDDGTYTIFYEAQSANGSTSIGMAKSLDGVSWTDRTQLIKPSDLGSNVTSISDPYCFTDENGERYLYFTYAGQDGVSKFGRVQLTADWWPMFHHDLSHLGYSTSRASMTNQTLWTSTTSGGIPISSPAVSGGIVYVGSDENVYALNAMTGALVWKCKTGGAVESSPAVANEIVYVGSYDGNVYALYATNGTRKWNYTTGGWVFSSPAVSGGIVYVGSSDDKVYALSASNGSLIWNYTTGGYVGSSPAVANGIVYVGSSDDNVYALYATNGTRKWNYTTGGIVRSSPAVAGGMVYVGSDDNRTYALSATTGKQVWNYTTGGWVSSSPAFAGGIVYVGSEDDNLYALNATTGALVWNYTTGDAVVFSSPAVSGGVVYVGSTNGNVYALNATTSALIWKYAIGTFVWSSPAVSGGVVYVCVVLNVYAFGTVHNVAVINVVPSRTLVRLCYNSLDVTAANLGSYNETFNVTVCANTTAIATQTVTLTRENSTTITLTWYLAGFARGSYIISAYAWPVSGETYTADNLCIGGTVQIYHWSHCGGPGARQALMM
jgi:outer membrane protein assembly factor BamB